MRIVRAAPKTTSNISNKLNATICIEREVIDMSTRSVIEFASKWGNGRVEAKVYKHSDGYPDGDSGNLAVLRSFFDTVQAQTRDTRFDDPAYLAAKFVVFLAAGYSRKYVWDCETHEGHYEKTYPLDFLSVGVVEDIPVDVEYVYTVHCGEGDPYPLVSWRGFGFNDYEIGARKLDLFKTTQPSQYWSNVFNE
jgi:hypothetical protein